MSLITILSFSDINIGIRTWIDYKGFFIISLVVLFPLLFLIQGMVCAINKTGIISVILSITVSIVDYMILMYVYLNDSAFDYIIFYFVAWIIGYTLTFLGKEIIYLIKK